MPTLHPALAARRPARLTAAIATAGLALAVGSPPADAGHRGTRTRPGTPVARFGLDAYAHLSRNSGNLAFSPISLYLALAILEQGADARAARTIGSALHLPRRHDRRALAAIETGLTALSGVQIGNGLWVATGAKLDSAYADPLKTALNAEIATIDVDHGDQARDNINRWIGDHTGGEITDLLPAGAIDASTVLVLASAIYFIGTWSDHFEMGRTSDGDFHLADGTTARVPMMHSGGSPARLAVTRDATMLELPYDSGLVMDVVVPADGVSLGKLEGQIARRFPRWTAALGASDSVAISLPRFHIDQSTDVAELLRPLGLGLVFDGLRLSRMLDRRHAISVSGAYHRTVIDVNETGTLAVSATAMRIEVAARHYNRTFTADRPFLWIVRDPSSDEILFMGRVADPR